MLVDPPDREAIRCDPPRGGPLRIAYAADDDYARPLAAAARSLLDNCAAGTRIDLVVLSSGITEQNQRRLARSWESVHLRSLTFVDVGKQSFGVLPRQSESNGHVMRAVYGRLAIPAVVPQDWDRILYLDADTVVREDLTALFAWNLNGEAVAARRDPIITELGHPGGVQCYEEIGADPRAPYCNSGVLAMDLELWRRRDLAGKVLSYVHVHGDRMNLRDQEGLNAVLRGSFAPLPWEWNTITLIGRDRVPRNPGVDIPERAKILHYVGPTKPWTSGGSRLPGAEYFFAALERTVWGGRSGRTE
nr:glycosyltransferase family 8 protein [Micromonospora sp. DSM 115978]